MYAIPKGPVAYDSGNHCQILCQCFGSLWPRVLFYCILNVLLMYSLTELQQAEKMDLQINSRGHSFAGLIVSFLVVSRINTAIARYNECRSYLGQMYRESRELLQTAFCLSRRDEDDNLQEFLEPKQWRQDLCYRTLVLLRTSVSVVKYRTTEEAAWEVPELVGSSEQASVRPGNALARDDTSIGFTANDGDTERSTYIDSLRVPLRLAYLLRETIVSHAKHLSKPLSGPEEVKLLSSVDSFLNGYYGMRKFLTTPVPFPLVQMTRTIVFLYVFTLPLVFLNDVVKDEVIVKDTVEHCVVIFLLTYGFVGLELVSIELDDPFGDDANDFDCLAFARMVFEDTYILVHDTDGIEWAKTLRDRMHEGPGDVKFCDESSCLLP